MSINKSLVCYSKQHLMSITPISLSFEARIFSETYFNMSLNLLGNELNRFLKHNSSNFFTIIKELKIATSAF